MAAARDVGRLFGRGVGGGGVFSSSSQLPQPFSLYGSSSSFLGSSSMVSFEDVCGGKRSERPFFCTYDQEENGDDDYDEYLHQPGKKRRLSIEQVHFLEKSFETDNKLEPDRKIQLAKELGLQPRQVAIWFQNRRARWKTKQMEKDFDKLQANYDGLKSDYESLLKEKEKLKAEVVYLSNKLEQKEQENPESCNMYDQLKTLQQNPNIESASAKSDVIDSDSSQYYVEAGHSSTYAEPGDSSYIFEADQSDISQDDEDYLNKSIMPSSHVFPKIEDIELPSNSGQLGLSGDDHATLFWPYWDINLKMPSSLYM